MMITILNPNVCFEYFNEDVYCYNDKDIMIEILKRQ